MASFVPNPEVVFSEVTIAALLMSLSSLLGCPAPTLVASSKYARSELLTLPDPDLSDPFRYAAKSDSRIPIAEAIAWISKESPFAPTTIQIPLVVLTQGSADTEGIP